MRQNALENVKHSVVCITLTLEILCTTSCVVYKLWLAYIYWWAKWAYLDVSMWKSFYMTGTSRALHCYTWFTRSPKMVLVISHLHVCSLSLSCGWVKCAPQSLRMICKLTALQEPTLTSTLITIVDTAQYNTGQCYVLWTQPKSPHSLVFWPTRSTLGECFWSGLSGWPRTPFWSAVSTTSTPRKRTRPPATTTSSLVHLVFSCPSWTSSWPVETETWLRDTQKNFLRQAELLFRI